MEGFLSFNTGVAPAAYGEEAAGLPFAADSTGVCLLAAGNLALAKALLRTAVISASAVDPAAGAGAAVALPPALLFGSGAPVDTPAACE